MTSSPDRCTCGRPMRSHAEIEQQARAEIQSTHWDGCWRHHLGCAVAYIEELTNSRAAEEGFGADRSTGNGDGISGERSDHRQRESGTRQFPSPGPSDLATRIEEARQEVDAMPQWKVDAHAELSGQVTTPDLDALEEAARAATPGPWEWLSRTERVWGTGVYRLDRIMENALDQDAHFIALANPATVLGLVEEVREWRDEDSPRRQRLTEEIIFGLGDGARSEIEMRESQLDMAEAVAARARAQLTEALSILKSGTDYERMHLIEILEAGL